MINSETMLEMSGCWIFIYTYITFIWLFHRGSRSRNWSFFSTSRAGAKQMKQRKEKSISLCWLFSNQTHAKLFNPAESLRNTLLGSKWETKNPFREHLGCKRLVQKCLERRPQTAAIFHQYLFKKMGSKTRIGPESRFANVFDVIIESTAQKQNHVHCSYVSLK